MRCACSRTWQRPATISASRYWAEGDRTAARRSVRRRRIAWRGALQYRHRLLASRDFAPAAQAFDDATALSPALTRARPRALQARTLADGSTEKTRERQ